MKILLENGERKPKRCTSCGFAVKFCKLWVDFADLDETRHPDCPIITEQEYASQLKEPQHECDECGHVTESTGWVYPKCLTHGTY